MATAESAPADRPARPFQFTLRQLFWLMGIVCLLGGAYSWLGTEVVLGLACIGAFLFFAYLVLNRQFVESLALTAFAFLLAAMFMPISATRLARHSSRQMECSNNLHNLAIALQTYHDFYGSFPPAYVADATGKPMHSWRVLILPFIEQKALYDLYKFDEPWDGPNNSKFHNVVLQIYSCPSNPGKLTETSYVAVVGPRTVFPDERTTRFSDIVDGPSNTLLIVEAHNAGIHWMEPRDLDYVQIPMTINPLRGSGISSYHPTLAQAAFADGSVHALPDDTPPATLRAILTRNGRETVELP